MVIDFFRPRILIYNGFILFSLTENLIFSRKKKSMW